MTFANPQTEPNERYKEIIYRRFASLSPDCSVLVSMYSCEMVFINQLDCLALAELSDFLTIIIAEFIDRFSDIRLQAILLHEEFLNLQPFVIFDDYHSREDYFVPVEPNPPSLFVSERVSVSSHSTVSTLWKVI